MRSRRCRRLATVMIVALAAASALVDSPRAEEPAPAKAPTESYRPPGGALIAPGDTPDIELLYSGNVIGYLGPCGCKLNPSGGLDRRAWLFEQLRDRFAGSTQLIFDLGNFSDNPTPEGNVKTRALVEAMGRLGYTAANVGERDLILGYDAFHALTEGASFPFISANIVDRQSKDPVFDPYVLVEVPRSKGTVARVGVVGVTRFNPVFLKSGPGDGNIVIAPPKAALEHWLPEIREQADIVIVLAALHKDDAQLLATELGGIDVVLGSYGAIYNAREEKVGDTLVAYAGHQGQRFGETRVFLDDGGKVLRTVSFMHQLSARYPSDPKWTEFVNLKTQEADRAAEGSAAPAVRAAGTPPAPGEDDAGVETPQRP